MSEQTVSVDPNAERFDRAVAILRTPDADRFGVSPGTRADALYWRQRAAIVRWCDTPGAAVVAGPRPAPNAVAWEDDDGPDPAGRAA